MTIACSAGCFICNQRGEGGSHSAGCCASTACDSRSWNEQVKKWLAAEDKYKARMKKQESAMTVRWLIAEKVWQEQQQQQARQNSAVIEAWLAAEQKFRATLTVKAPQRVNKERQVNSPKIAKQRVAALQHNR